MILTSPVVTFPVCSFPPAELTVTFFTPTPVGRPEKARRNIDCAFLNWAFVVVAV